MSDEAKSEADRRRERQAAALRENLRRRKAQARARRPAMDPGSATPADPLTPATATGAGHDTPENGEN